MRDAAVLWTIAAVTVLSVIGLVFVFRRIVKQFAERVEESLDGSERRIRAELRATYLVLGPPLADPPTESGGEPPGVPSPRHPFRVIAGGGGALMLFVAAVSKASRLHPGVATAVVAGAVLAVLPLVVQPGTERVAGIPPSVAAGPPSVEPPPSEVPSVTPESEPPGVDDLPADTAVALPPPADPASEVEDGDEAPEAPTAPGPVEPTVPTPPPTVDPPPPPPVDGELDQVCLLEVPLKPLLEVCLLPSGT